MSTATPPLDDLRPRPLGYQPSKSAQTRALDFNLAPGEATSTIWWTGEIERRGRYTIQVRQALDPEFWGEIQIVAR